MTTAFGPPCERAAVDRRRASILLTHAPDRVGIAEEEGISLQLSGHTHGGQFFFLSHGSRPGFTADLSTDCSAWEISWCTHPTARGTWGPPLRVGTKPEIVLLQFE